MRPTGEPLLEVPEDFGPEDLLEGIPAQVIEQVGGCDRDTAGGCG